MEDNETKWRLYIDRVSCKGTRGAGIVLKGPNTIIIKYTLRLVFKSTNNVAEYKTLIKGLDLAKEMKPRRLNIYGDSQLVIGQISGQFEAKEGKMAKYQRKVQE